MRDEKEDRRKYIQRMKDKGYTRVNKWCPVQYRESVNSVIDILSCYFEDPNSTADFSELIETIISESARYKLEYQVKNDSL